MKGLELARRYYEAYGRPMLRERFPEAAPYIAAGLAGSGSECLGYDDEISADHDFGPGFCLWLPGEDVVDRKTAFRLERAYAALPAEFEGYRRPAVAPVGGARTGVIRMADFFAEKTGSPTGEPDAAAWLRVPVSSLGEAVNGAVFDDPYGVFSSVRERLGHMPRDIRLKRMAGHLLTMAQSGQYNYQRCLDHGEEGAALLSTTGTSRFTSGHSGRCGSFRFCRSWSRFSWAFCPRRTTPRQAFASTPTSRPCPRPSSAL